MNLMIVADDDISPEELHQALQNASHSRKRRHNQSEEQSSSCCSERKKSTLLKNSSKCLNIATKKKCSRPVSSINSNIEFPSSENASNSDIITDSTSLLLATSEIRSGILKRINRNHWSDIDSDTEDDGYTSFSDKGRKCREASNKCYSDDLKERLKKTVSDSDSVFTNGHEKVSEVGGSVLQIVQNGIKSNRESSVLSHQKYEKDMLQEKSVSEHSSTSHKSIAIKADTKPKISCSERDDLNSVEEDNVTADDRQDQSDDCCITKISPSLIESPRQEKTAEYFTQLSDSIPDHAYVALDCEMVGVGLKGKKSVLGRCSVLDYKGHIIYDKFVRPSEVITDFRTPWSGIRPRNMVNAVPIDTALKDIQACLKNKIVIGHAVYNDFKVLRHQISNHMVRDTASCKLLSEWAGLAIRSNGLKKLSAAVLGRAIQVGKKGHCSAEDALASLDLFKLARRQWEPELLRCWDKKGVDVAAAIQGLVENISHRRDSVGEDFLEDKFWPKHVTH